MSKLKCFIIISVLRRKVSLKIRKQERAFASPTYVIFKCCDIFLPGSDDTLQHTLSCKTLLEKFDNKYKILVYQSIKASSSTKMVKIINFKFIITNDLIRINNLSHLF